MSSNVMITSDGERDLAPREELPDRRRAWESNLSVTSRDYALEVARGAVESGELDTAVVWASGVGSWLVNGYAARCPECDATGGWHWVRCSQRPKG